MGTKYLAVPQADKTLLSSHCICFTTGKLQELPVEFQCPVQPSDASDSWSQKPAALLEILCQSTLGLSVI